MTDVDAAEVLADIKRRRGKVSDDQRFLAGHEPALLAAYEALYDVSLVAEAALPVKVREFIAIGILLARAASEAGIERHMRRAIEHGASIAELIAALQAMVVPGGGPVFNRGLSILRKVAENLD